MGLGQPRGSKGEGVKLSVANFVKEKKERHQRKLTQMEALIAAIVDVARDR